MLEKMITYQDFNGNEISEVFRFNLSKAEVMEMELSTTGGFGESLKRIAASKNAKDIIETFKYIILKAYGERSDDGKRFIKSDELSKSFTETNAYSELFMELATNEEAALSFIRSVVPEALLKQ